MVKIVYKPWKELVIHEITRYTKEELIERSAAYLGAEEPGSLNWANGILFTFAGMEQTEEVIAEQLENRVHWINIAFAVCEKYKSQVKSRTGRYVNIFDVSNNEIMNEVTQWLKKRIMKV